MATKIRLMRIGSKKRPYYRIVAVDEHKKRTGGYIELLGTYNPLTEPKEINLKKDRIQWWLQQGAVPSDGYLRITKQAPQKPPRKPKREKQSGSDLTSAGSESQTTQQETIVEEQAADEQPENIQASETQETETKTE